MANEQVVVVSFLCGCNLTVDPTMRIIQDEERFVICPNHSLRRSGWRSPLKDQYKLVPFDPTKPKYVSRINWGRRDIENEVEFWKRLGIDI
jgi:hypothetical protein